MGLVLVGAELAPAVAACSWLGAEHHFWLAVGATKPEKETLCSVAVGNGDAAALEMVCGTDSTHVDHWSPRCVCRGGDDSAALCLDHSLHCVGYIDVVETCKLV